MIDMGNGCIHISDKADGEDEVQVFLVPAFIVFHFFYGNDFFHIVSAPFFHACCFEGFI